MGQSGRETEVQTLYDLFRLLGRGVGSCLDAVGLRDGAVAVLEKSTSWLDHDDDCVPGASDDYSSLRQETPWYRDDGSPMMYNTESFSSALGDDDFSLSSDDSFGGSDSLFD